MSWASSKGFKGALVFFDNAYNHQRWLDAIGESVVKFILNPGETSPVDDSTGDPTQWIINNTEAGAGNTTLLNSEAVGEALILTTAGNEYDGACDQVKNIAFKCESGKPMYFGIQCKASEATQIDLLVGMMVKDTACLKHAASHGITAAGVEGIFFVKIDGGTDVLAKTYKDGAEKNSASAGTLTTGVHWYEFYWDGAVLYMYFDAAEKARFTTNLPDTELTPTFDVANGDANARTLKISALRAIELR